MPRSERSPEATTAENRGRRLLRTLTFWLRPAFTLRALGRFQRIAGFDRSMALASSALTALVPLVILGAAVLTSVGSYDIAQQLITRYGLTGEGAAAVDSLFAPEEEKADVSVIGVLFLAVSALSFTRALQRLFEQTWELTSLSVRNTRNGLGWLLSGACYMAISGLIQSLPNESRAHVLSAVAELPVTAVFLVWSGVLLSARRIAWRDLVPFGVTGAVAIAVYSVGATLYLPHLFNTSAHRYGVVGAVFAMISALFAVMLCVVGASVVGREVRDELTRISHGERTPDDEVRRQWDAMVDQARSRWRTARRQVTRRRAGPPPDD
ncbi:YhjD/YihY/BrkB family envelope integrity protein [Streptomyces sp. NPDC048106]|uniref:YhjD/YihY/BrkB family envelope integrity protein n=1 Tax=Streptomyces sp. NPDC048106 TaxID=3155750 RepID=UPI0034527AD7